MPDTAAVRPGEELDLPRLTAYLDQHLAPDAYTLEQFPGGHSNLTYLLRGREREYVLRRAPLGPLPPKAHDMAREYDVLARVHPVFPKAPAVIHLCRDTSVIGAVFYLMERRHGVIHRDPSSIGFAAREHAEALVDTLIELHAVDLRASGLEGLGKPEGFLERQVTGWVGRWNAALLPDSPDAGHVLAALARIPASPPATIVHNDFKLDNVMFAPDAPRLTAVLDWEMTTIGDPLADLGLALCYWTLGGASPRAAGPPPAGWLTRDEVIARYGRATGRDLTHVAWHEMLGVFKLAVILQQIYVRYVRGQTTDARFADFGGRVRLLIERATALAEQSL